MKRAAIFDMDGLLIDSEPLWRKAEIHCFKKVGLSLTDDDCRKTMGYRLNEVIDYWFDQKPWKSVTKSDLEKDILDTVIELVEKEGKPMPGVYEALCRFEDWEFTLALASSSSLQLINAVLGTLKLENRFKVVKSAQNEAFGKPHPQVFIATAGQLGVSAHQCVVLEDSFHGVIAAKAAKMKVIAVPDKEEINLPKFAAADRVVGCLDDIDEEIVKQLFGNS